MNHANPSRQRRREEPPISEAPEWARLQTHVIAELEHARRRFARRYTSKDGSLAFSGALDEARDGGDDFLEPFAQVPLLALASADAETARAAVEHLEAVSTQLDRLGYTIDGIDKGTDWFHLGEGNELRYHTGVAVPDIGARERATELADTYVDPAVGNYDPEQSVLRSPHPGADGPRWGYLDSPDAFRHRDDMKIYGLPLHDVPGTETYDDLRDPRIARTMGEAMASRFGRGDVAVNLAATGAAFNAWLFTQDDRYRDWILTYVSAWEERARVNGGVIPDNVGLSGAVGEYHDGRWWGGLYGWHWPHGAHSVLYAVAVAAIAAYQVSGDPARLNFIREQFDLFASRGRVDRIRNSRGALRSQYLSRFDPDELDEYALLAPHRIGPDGWTDFLPVEPTIPAAIWQLTGDAADWARIERLRASSSYDWNRTRHTRLKEDSGHEEPWLRFLAGRNPGYPISAMRSVRAVVRERSAQVEADRSVGDVTDIHHWQNLNPLTTEHLLQCRLGAPSPIYYGGHVQPAVHVEAGETTDSVADIGMLVTRIGAQDISVTAANTVPELRRIRIAPGRYGMHALNGVTVSGGARIGERSLDSVELHLEPHGTAHVTLHIARDQRPARLGTR